MSPLILPFDQLCHICIKLGCCFSGMIKASFHWNSYVYLAEISYVVLVGP